MSNTTNPAITNCFLKSAQIQNPGDRTNTTNSLGVHSGRYLGPWPATNRVILARPIPLITNTLYNGYSIGFDYAALTCPGGLNWQITEFSSPTLYVGGLGFVSLSTTDLNNRDGLTALSLSYNNNSAPYTLPTNIIPRYSVAHYWTLGFAFPDTQQGIYYQVDVISPGRFFISIEYFYTRWTTNNDVFHWITTYDTGAPGVWTSWFFESGTPDDRGLYQTVGHQGTQSLGGIVGQITAENYQAGQAGSVLAGGKSHASIPFSLFHSHLLSLVMMRVERLANVFIDRIFSNTIPGQSRITRTQGAFDIVAFGQPGRWDYINSPR